MTTSYTKEPLSVKSQIELLKSRGLIIDDEATAEVILYNVSYFRLVAYLRPMDANKETHEFKPNSHFNDAVALYRFDCELRNLIFKAVQDIEIALRTRIIQEFSMRNGAFWFYDTSLATDGHQFLENMTSLDKELKRSKEDFIREHYAKYDNPAFPPSWKSLELASFGTLSKFYYNFGDIRAKKLVARLFNLPQHKVLETTITLFSNLRFKGVGRHPKTWKKKGGIKVHTNIHANEGVLSDIRFTSAATNDSFMLNPTNYNDGDIIAMGRDYIDYSKFEELTNRGVIYVTKMKKKPKVISLLTNDISKKSTFA